MNYIYLVRHAQSTANASTGMPIIGEDNKVLTEHGHEQAINLPKQMASDGIHPATIVSSPLMRAIQTAEHLAESFNLTIDVKTNLREFDYLRPLDPATMTSIDRANQKSKFWQESTSNYDYVDGGASSGADSFNTFINRAKRCVKILIDAPSGSILISHGIMMLSILELINGSGDEQIFNQLRSVDQGERTFPIKNVQVIRLAKTKRSISVDTLDLLAS